MQRLSTLPLQTRAPIGVAAVAPALSHYNEDLTAAPAIFPSNASHHQADSCMLECELAQLAAKFPRFKSLLAKLRNHVLAEGKDETTKREAVLECLSNMPTALEDLIKETDLGRLSVEQAARLAGSRGQGREV